MCLEQASPRLGHGEWWGVEDECLVDADQHTLPLLKKDGLASTPARYLPHSRHHPLGASQDQINLHCDDGARRSAPKELPPHYLSATFGEDSGGKRYKDISELEKDSLLTLPQSSPDIDPKHHQRGPSNSGFKGPGYVTPLHSPGQEEDERATGHSPVIDSR